MINNSIKIHHKSRDNWLAALVLISFISFEQVTMITSLLLWWCCWKSVASRKTRYMHMLFFCRSKKKCHDQLWREKKTKTRTNECFASSMSIYVYLFTVFFISFGIFSIVIISLFFFRRLFNKKKKCRTSAW